MTELERWKEAARNAMPQPPAEGWEVAPMRIPVKGGDAWVLALTLGRWGIYRSWSELVGHDGGDVWLPTFIPAGHRLAILPHLLDLDGAVELVTQLDAVTDSDDVTPEQVKAWQEVKNEAERKAFGLPLRLMGKDRNKTNADRARRNREIRMVLRATQNSHLLQAADMRVSIDPDPDCVTELEYEAGQLIENVIDMRRWLEQLLQENEELASRPACDCKTIEPTTASETAKTEEEE